MDGVRRWITSGSPTNRKSAHVEAWHVPPSKTSITELKPDKNSTEYIAVALLDPSVPPGEETEYGVYIAQCYELSRAPQEYAARKDQRTYEGAVSLASSGGSDTATVRDKDVETYVSHVEKGRPFTSDFVGEKERLPIQFDYEKWLGGVS